MVRFKTLDLFRLTTLLFEHAGMNTNVCDTNVLYIIYRCIS